MRKLMSVVCLVLLSTISETRAATTITEQWVVFFNGGGGTLSEQAVGIARGGDGHPAFTARTNNGDTIYVAKHNFSTGALIWSTPFVNGNLTRPDVIAADSAGDVLVGGLVGSTGGANAQLFRYTSAAGTRSTVGTFGGTIFDTVSGIAIDGSNNVAVTAGVSTSTALATRKYTPAGALTFGVTTSATNFKDVIFDPSGNVISCGGRANTDTDGLIVKYNGSTGAVIWIRSDIVGNAAGTDRINDVVTDSAGNVYGAGIVRQDNGGTSSSDFFVVKLNAADGTEAWRYVVNGTGNTTDEAFRLAITSGGDPIAVGRVTNTNRDLYAVRLNGSTGAPVWTRTIDGPQAGADEARNVGVDAAGNAYVSGTFGKPGPTDFSDHVTVRLNAADGATEWSAIYNGPSGGSDNSPSSTGVGLVVAGTNDVIVLVDVVNSVGLHNDVAMIRYVAAGDTTPPTATLAMSDSALKIGDTSTLTVTFSEAVTGFTNADLTIPNGTLTAVSSGDGGVTWTATYTPNSSVTDTSNMITLALSGVSDLASNAGTGTASTLNFTIDTVRPTAALAMSDSALIAGESSLLTVTFSEAVTGFTNADLTIPNGSLTAVSSGDGGVTWTATFTPNAGVTDASNVIMLNLSGVSDGVGNAGTGTASTANFIIDTLRPTAALALSDSALIIGDTSTLTVSFSEAVTGLTNADLTIPNGSLTAVSSGDGGVTWTATFTPNAGVTDTSNVITLALSGVSDAPGNAGTASADTANFTIDTARPTATLALSDSSLIAGETATLTVTFSEAVTGFTNADLTIPNGSLSAVSSGDGGVTWTATFTPSANVTDASNVIMLNLSGVSDGVGNAGTGTASTANFIIDTLRPTAALALSDSALIIGDTSTLTVSFSEAVTGLTNADLTIPNGSLTAVSSGDGGVTWTATYTPTSNVTDASNVITLALSGVSDGTGNAGTGTASTANFTIDTARPTATLALSDSSLTVGETATLTVTFSEAVTGFTNADLTIPNGTLTSVSSGDGGITWTATFTPTANLSDATNVIVLDLTGVTDAAGNAGTGTAQTANFTIDTNTPSATLAMSDSALKVGDTSTLTVTFSEAVNGFTNADLTIPNGTLAAVTTSNNIVFTATYTPNSNVTAATNVITLDQTGVTSVATSTPGVGTVSTANFSIDTVRPTAALSMSDSALKIGDTSTLTVTFSEAVTGFTNADLTIANGTLTSVSTADGGITWTATFTPAANTTAATNVITLDLTGVADAAGNAGTGTASTTNFTIDTVGPTATLVMSDSALAVGETATLTITFSEAVTGFTTADLTTANGALASLSSGDGGITWTATFTPAANTTATTNVITLALTGVADLAGNPGTGTASTANYTIDTARPTATLSMSDSALTIGDTSTLTVTFSEAVTGFTNADLTIANGTLTSVSTADGGITWTATFTPAANTTAATNVITLDLTGVADAAGNAGTGTASTTNFTIDTVGSTATLVMSDSALAVGETATLTITFSEAVTGFTTADLMSANGVLSSLSSSDGGVTWTATYTPSANVTDATNVITLDLTGVADTAGNTGTGTASTANFTVDTVRPTATLALSDSTLIIGETATLTVTFSEAVTGFTNADLTIPNGTLTSVASADGGVTWTSTYTPTANVADATNVITLDLTGVADTAGNAGTGTASTANFTVDTVRPTGTLAQSDLTLIIGETGTLTVTFSEAVSGFTNEDLTIPSGTLSAVASSDGGITWTATFTPNVNITSTTNVITLDLTGVTDAAGNAGTGSAATANFAIDTTRPTVTLALSDTALSVGETATLTVTFSEAVTGFANANLSADNGTLTALTTADSIVFSATFTPSAGIFDATNAITLTLAGIADQVGNAGAGTATSPNYAINTSGPTDFALSGSSVPENSPAGTVVGMFSATDAVAGDTFTYTFAAGGADNGLFSIVGDTLSTAASFNFETKASYDIRIRCTDSGGNFFEKSFVISVTDVNDAPVIASGPTANPSVARVGEKILFSCVASGTGTLAYSWNFGDGGTEIGGQVTYAYAAVGTYTVAVTVSDGDNAVSANLSVVVIQPAKVGDQDDDGFDDVIETALKTDPNSEDSTPFDLDKPVSSESGLTVKRLLINKTPIFSRLVLRGSLPMPIGVEFKDKPVILNVGGVVRSFVLNDTVRAVGENEFDVFRRSGRKNGRISFLMILRKGDYSGITQNAGSIPVVIIFNGNRYEVGVPIRKQPNL